MIDTKALKDKILDLAMRGKLTPQDPNDEPASELLKRIKAEKEKLINQKKLNEKKMVLKFFKVMMVYIMRSLLMRLLKR